MAMWKNFLQSLLLLAIAMMAALYSSSAGREARVGAAITSAFVALSIAVWVGFRFVPRLARAVDWEWVPFVSRYKITAAGWVFLGGVLVVIFAAVNTSNNLLYMVLSGLLAVLLLSGFLSSLNFRLLKLHLRLPSRCFAGEKFQFSLRMENQKRIFPALSLAVEPAAGAFRFDPLSFGAVRGRTTQPQAGIAEFTRRGVYKIDGLKVASHYPFGFFVKERRQPIQGAECVCYPAILPQDHLGTYALDMQGSHQSYQRGSGSDLYRIRDYVPSDSGRHVHWKASAKTGRLKTREYAAEDDRRVVLGLDRFGHPGDEERFEQLVSQAATLAFYCIQEGSEVSFISDEWATTHGKSGVLLDSILNYLSAVQMSAEARTPDIDTSTGAMLLSLRQQRG